jgi:pyruvate kinase
MKRERSARILATLGPASSTRERIRALAEAGADVFRLNFSHGSHEDHAERYRLIRAVEAEIGRPIGVLMDLQGPKLRVGRFAEGKVALVPGARFRLDLDPTAGDAKRANLPHPEIFAALEAGTELLLDDGKLRLRVDACGADFADTTVLVGGTLSDRKGVNVPGVVLPISPLTAKDRADLDFGLALGVDWVALSFVQRPEDCARRASSSATAPGSWPSSRSRRRSTRSTRSSRSPTASWSRAATSAWSCHRSRCRCCSAASCGPHAQPAVRWWWRRRCWSR